MAKPIIKTKFIEKDGKKYENKTLSLRTKDYGLGDEITLKVKELKKSGQGKYGQWNLWLVDYDGEEYGCFPSQGINNTFLRNIGNTLTLKKQVKTIAEKEFILFDVINTPEKKPEPNESKELIQKLKDKDGNEEKVIDIINMAKNSGNFDNKAWWDELGEMNGFLKSDIDLIYDKRKNY